MNLFATVAFAGSVSSGPMQFDWQAYDDEIVATVQAPTEGWVTVGFSDRSDLRGAVLLFGACVSGNQVIEEHVALPPTHSARHALGGVSGLRRAEVVCESGRTSLRFVWRVRTGDRFDRLRVGGPAWLTLAYSDSADFTHHSAYRVAVAVDLWGGASTAAPAQTDDRWTH